MLQIWLIEVIKGIGKFFLHPLFYFLLLIAFLIGFQRVKKEREQFNIRVNEITVEMRYMLTSGLVAGFVASVVLLLVGVTIPNAALLLLTVLTILLSVTGNVRLLSPAYIIGFTFFGLILIMNYIEFTTPILKKTFAPLSANVYPSIAVLLGILLLCEAFLILKDRDRYSSPQIVKGKRGLNIGVHVVKRLSIVPVMLIVPGKILTTPVEWWPIFTIGEETYSLLLIPFAIGFFQRSKGMLPKIAARKTGKRLLVIGIITTVLAVGSYFEPHLSIIAVAFAIISREILHLRHRIYDEGLPAYFTNRNKGLTILGIIPESPADKMGLEIGEVIFKVNGLEVHDEFEFYSALQKNSAHCKLEVIGENDENRFVQRALYEGDHHKLGILFVRN